jgi:hypothetical protein
MKFLKIDRLIATILVVFFLFTKASVAQELIEKFHDWSLFKTKRGDKFICYIAATPIKREGNYNKSGEPFFLITDIENDADEITVSSGFIYGKNSNVEISFGSKKFYLFPYKVNAWANNKSDDIDIIKEMQKSSDFIVSGVARDSRIAIDSYSLIGFPTAYQEMKRVCEER